MSVENAEVTSNSHGVSCDTLLSRKMRVFERKKFVEEQRTNKRQQTRIQE